MDPETNTDKAELPSDAPAKDEDNHILPTGITGEVETLSSRLALRLTELGARVSTTQKQIEADLDRSPFHRRIFVQLPTQHNLSDLATPVVEELQLYGVLFTKGSFLHLLDQQYVAGPDNCGDNPSRWAVLSTFFAISILYRTVNSSLEAKSPMSWGYFKNAFAMFPELVIQADALSACEALIIMATFMVCTPDARTTSQLAAASARLVCVLGLHQKDHYLTLDADIAARHRRVFWAAYILNADLTHKYGLLSPFGSDEVSVDLPEDDGIDGPLSATTSIHPKLSNPPGHFRHMAKLAIIQSRIHALLPSDSALETQNSALLDATIALHNDLETWKSTLPERLQPQRHAPEEVSSDMRLAMLHYIYHSCAAKLYTAATHQINLGASSLVYSGGFSRALGAASARAIFSVMHRSSPQPFFQLW